MPPSLGRGQVAPPPLFVNNFIIRSTGIIFVLFYKKYNIIQEKNKKQKFVK